MTKSTTELLREHFEKLKQSIPEVYEASSQDEESQEDKLFGLIRRSLTIIEAVYFQNREMFTPSRAEEYTSIIDELKELGFYYSGNPELIEKAARSAILSAKKPMAKAKGNKEDLGRSDDRKAM
jgi:hypothetical protein